MNPEGKYHAKIAAPPELKTNSKGNPELVYTIELLGKYEGTELYEMPPGTTSRRTMWATITDNTADRRAAELQFMDPRIGNFDEVDPNAAEEGHYISIVDKEVDVTCKHDMWNGQAKEKYEFDMRGFVLSSPGSTKQTLDKSVVSKVRQRFGKFFGKGGDKPPF